MFLAFVAVQMTAAPAAQPPVAERQVFVTADRTQQSLPSVTVGESAPLDAATEMGVTVVRVQLKRDGDFKSCEVATSSGRLELDEAACVVARQIHSLPPDPKPEEGRVWVRPPYKGKRDFLQRVVWRSEG